MGFRVWGLGFRVWAVGCGVWGLGLGGLGFRNSTFFGVVVQGLSFVGFQIISSVIKCLYSARTECVTSVCTVLNRCWCRRRAPF